MSLGHELTEEDLDWAEADHALETARMLPPAPERIAALKQMLRNIAVKAGIVFQRRGRPPK